MEYLIYATIGLIGIWLGRALAAQNHKACEKFGKLGKKDKETVRQKKERRKKIILDLARGKKKITNDDVENILKVSNATAERYLNELEKEGKLKQVGETGRGVYYVLK